MRVELDIFSGRPNPVWELDAAQETELRSRLARLAPATARVSVPGLGYRGFVLRNGGVWRVRGEWVAGDLEEETTALWSDPARVLEQWLLESGRTALSGEMFEMARSLIAAG